MPAAGQKAPAFKGVDQFGNAISLAGLKGHRVALFFYPEDDTPTCTKEVCNLRDNEAALRAAGYTLVGVSPDAAERHVKFSAKYGLPFSLLPDPEHRIIKAYGVWAEKQMYGRKYMGLLRTTFLIDAQGKVERVIAKVKSADHAAQILND